MQTLPLLSFQHTAARRRLEATLKAKATITTFQHTAARRRLALVISFSGVPCAVSTHSRPKAAGQFVAVVVLDVVCFNTQPPEGGWGVVFAGAVQDMMFQHTAARRRLVAMPFYRYLFQCFNTQPPEGGWSLSQKPCSIRFRSPDFAKLPRKARTRV